jgi:hypothetical protein
MTVPTLGITFITIFEDSVHVYMNLRTVMKRVSLNLDLSTSSVAVQWQ